MKKIYLGAFFCVALFFSAKSAVWEVSVSSFQFSPAVLNVQVGDIVRFTWVDGFHTTTSLAVPSGALPWDSPIDDGTTVFDYLVTEVGVYSYECTPHGAGGMTGTFTASAVVPVTLSAFTVSSQNDQPILNWETQTEQNVSHFSIRKSLDGTHFTDIGTVPASGNSTTIKQYQFVDESPASDQRYVFYCLAIHDLDAKVQLSPIKSYRNNLIKLTVISFMSPNPVPAAGHLRIRFNSDRASTMDAVVTDAQGKTVLHTKLSAEVGLNNGHIHLADLPAGNYFIRFSLNGITETHGLIKE